MEINVRMSADEFMELIHLCFTCDPYPVGRDTFATREVIKILKEYENNVQILTKGNGTSKIAAKYGTTYQALAAYNGIGNPNLIRVGQKIRIPGTGSSIQKGSKVRVNSGAKTYTGGGLASFVYTTVYEVIQISGDRAVIGMNGKTTAAMNVKDLTLA